MGIEIIAPGASIGNGYPAKPAYGDPCNGCGVCCLAVQCPISIALFGDAEICPALVEAGNALACGLMIDTKAHVPEITDWGGATLTETFSLLIGSGIGCDGQGDDEQPDAEVRRKLIERAEAKIAAASPEAQMLVAYFRLPTPPLPTRERTA